MHPPNAIYVDAVEEPVDCSFQSFEIAHVTYVGEGAMTPKPYISDCLNMQKKDDCGKRMTREKDNGCIAKGFVSLLFFQKQSQTLALDINHLGKKRLKWKKRRSVKRWLFFKGVNLMLKGWRFHLCMNLLCLPMLRIPII